MSVLKSEPLIFQYICFLMSKYGFSFELGIEKQRRFSAGQGVWNFTKNNCFSVFHRWLLMEEILRRRKLDFLGSYLSTINRGTVQHEGRCTRPKSVRDFWEKKDFRDNKQGCRRFCRSELPLGTTRGRRVGNKHRVSPTYFKSSNKRPVGSAQVLPLKIQRKPRIMPLKVVYQCPKLFLRNFGSSPKFRFSKRTATRAYKYQKFCQQFIHFLLLALADLPKFCLWNFS